MVHRFLIALVAASIACCTFAQNEPRFFIERIDVRNAHRVSPALIVAETLLHPNTEVSEAELSAASARLNRLPFLLSATFSLERGQERPHYTLVIVVEETTPFFFLLDGRPTLRDDSRHTVDYDIDPASDSKDGALGMRWFVGGRGIVHTGVMAQRDAREYTTSFTAWTVGYTQYEIFGTRAFATFNLRLPFDSPARGELSPQLVVGLPLTANQTLTFDAESMHFRRHFGNANFALQDAERRFTLTWTYNTTDDPFLPTHGTIVRVAPMRTMRDRGGFQFVQTAGPRGLEVPYAQHVNGFGGDLSASRYFELNDRDSISAGLLAGWLDIDDRQHPPLHRGEIVWRPAYEVLRATWSRNLHQSDARRRIESRIELETRFSAQQRNVSEGKAAFGTIPMREHFFQTSVSWARRSTWGMLRLGMGFVWGR